MAVSNEDIQFMRDLFSEIPDLSSKKMFGGLSLYSSGTIFAIIGPDEKIYVKASGDLVDDLETDGAQQWEYTDKKGKVSKMPYWTLPDAALDDPALASEWGRRALALLQ